MAIRTVKRERAAAALESAVEEAPLDFGPGLVIGVVTTEGLIAIRAWGCASLELGSPVDSRTAFYLASVSKQFTAACVLVAHDQGCLALEDEVRTHVPELPAWTEGVQVRHLLAHCAGLPEYGDLVEASGRTVDDVLTDELILELLAAHPGPVFAPGAQFAYSGTGYWLLGVVIGRATGQSLRAFAHDQLFVPLMMSHTSYRDDHWEIVPNLAEGYMPADRGGWRHWRTCFDRVGDGGVVSTLEDLAIWERNVLAREEPWLELAERLEAPFELGDGSVSDWRAGVVLDPFHGRRAVLVGGTGFGYRAFGVRLPASEITVYALSNLGTMDVRRAAMSVLEDLTRG